MPHTEPRDYYVTLRRQAKPRPRTAFLAGPFATYGEAAALVKRAAAEAEKIDPWVHFDARGVSSLPVSLANPPGRLNSQIGVTPRSLLPPY